MDAQVLRQGERTDGYWQAYVVFLLLHLLFTIGIVTEFPGRLPAVLVLLIFALLGAYSFAARFVSFAWTMVLTLGWFATVSYWFLGWIIAFNDLMMKTVYTLLFIVYSILFLSGPRLKRAPLHVDTR